MVDQTENRPTRSGEAVQTTSSRQATESQAQQGGNEVDVRTMFVGLETSFSGQISSCNRLIVEGAVDARFDNCQYVIINESGVFKGDVSTDNADVHGRFDGDIFVRKRLLVRSTGQVSGTITYGEIEVERGGKLSGALKAYG